MLDIRSVITSTNMNTESYNLYKSQSIDLNCNYCSDIVIKPFECLNSNCFNFLCEECILKFEKLQEDKIKTCFNCKMKSNKQSIHFINK